MAKKTDSERSKEYKLRHPRKAKIQNLFSRAKIFIRKSDKKELPRLHELYDLYVSRIKEVKENHKNG